MVAESVRFRSIASSLCSIGHDHPFAPTGLTGTRRGRYTGQHMAQCGPPGVALAQRNFKQKDMVENFLAKRVREGRMELSAAQKAIASDWTQFLDAAKQACPNGR